MDGDVHARREAAVLVGIAIDREVQEIGADAAVVEQRVALAGAPYPQMRLPWSLAAMRNDKSLRLVRRTWSANEV